MHRRMRLTLDLSAWSFRVTKLPSPTNQLLATCAAPSLSHSGTIDNKNWYDSFKSPKKIFSWGLSYKEQYGYSSSKYLFILFQNSVNCCIGEKRFF